MKKTIVEDRKTKIIDDIICDSCGKSCVVNVSTIDNDVRLDHGTVTKSFEYMELSADWGYYSNGKDLSRWTAQICEQCVEQKLSFINFKKQKQTFTSCIHTED